ncbi:MAG: (2Fe-2S)-binding protein [Halobacteriovoraceae bacterium]|nr:(2Fe-2S)-binding protein [Halobacteriovoraceae bacterium]
MSETKKLSSCYRKGDISISIHWEIDEEDRITRLACDYKNNGPWQRKLQRIIKQARGLTVTETVHAFLQEIPSDTDPVINLPFMLFRKALLDYRGHPECHASILGKKNEQLICRCFGVYNKSIEELIWQKQIFSLKDITNQLKAGGGCTRCLPNIEQMLIPATLSPVKLALKLEKIKENWPKEIQRENIQVDIMEVDKNKISISINPEKDAGYLLKSLQNYLNFYCPGIYLSLFHKT